MSSEARIALIPKTPAEVAKAILYLVVTVLAIYRISAADGVTAAEWVNIGIAILGLIPVYWFAGTLVKTIIAFALAGAQALVLVLGTSLGFSDVTPDSWIGVALAAFAAIGIAVVPNKPMIDARDTNNISSLPPGDRPEAPAKLDRIRAAQE